MTCNVDGCPEQVWIRKRKLCRRHYRDWWRTERMQKPSLTVGCQRCGESFEARRPNQKYCSAKCSNQRQGIACAVCGGPIQNSRTTLPEGRAVCRPCRQASPIPYKLKPIPCPVCRGEFTPYAARIKTCSKSCGARLRAMTLRPAGQDAVDRQRERWQAKNRRRRAAKRGQPSEPYTLTEIAERDRSRCQLCRRKVNMALKAPHPKSPTIDHVVPIADGGDDTRANVQLAHFGCNSSKGARGSQQLALVG